LFIKCKFKSIVIFLYLLHIGGNNLAARISEVESHENTNLDDCIFYNGYLALIGFNELQIFGQKRIGCDFVDLIYHTVDWSQSQTVSIIGEAHSTKPQNKANGNGLEQREKRFLAACSAALQKHKFRTVLNRQLTRGAVLDKFLAQAAAVLGIALSRRPIVRDALDDVLLAIAPALRLGLLRLPTDGMLKALALGEVIVRRTRALSSAPPTLQGTYDLLVKIGPTLRLLASDQEPLVLPKLRHMKLPPFEAPQVMFAAFAAHRAAERRTPTLEALEKAMQPTLSTADRALLLLDLGSRADVAAVPQGR
jgi:hypothetical protein